MTETLQEWRDFWGPRGQECNTREYAREVVIAHWKLLIELSEPLKALDALLRIPACLEGDLEIESLIALSRHRLRHVFGGFQLNRELYTSAAGLANELRARLDLGEMYFLTWLNGLAKEGEPLRFLSIGSGGCIVERLALQVNPRVHFTVVDFSRGFAEKLAIEFPNRVESCVLVDHFAYPTAQFDAIIAFEVIEHVVNDVEFLLAVNRRLKVNGVFFLSTPNTTAWALARLSSPDGMPPPTDWYVHVRSHSPRTLWRLLRECGFDGTLTAAKPGVSFLAVMHRSDDYVAPKCEIQGAPVAIGTELETLRRVSAEKTTRDVVFRAARSAEMADIIYGFNGVLWPDEPGEDKWETK